LDRLALLFANIKSGNKTPENVTATGLTQNEKGKCWKVYIAKNNGPRDGKLKTDKKKGNDTEFASTLQTWLNMPEDQYEIAKESNEYWVKLLEFWANRIKNYRNAAKWEDIESHKDEIAGFFKKEERDFNRDKFDDEWAEVSKLLPRISDTSNNLLFYYEFWRRESRQQYPPVVAKSAAADYCNAIHCLEMLAMPYSMWAAFKEFRVYRSAYGVKINIILVEELTLRETHLNYQEIADSLQKMSKDEGIHPRRVLEDLNSRLGERKADQLRRDHGRKDDEVQSLQAEAEQVTKSLKSAKVALTESKAAQLEPDQDSIEKLEATVKSLQDKSTRVKTNLNHAREQAQTLRSNLVAAAKGPSVYLHCEMQILILFHQLASNTEIKVHPFIGCSKLSCHMCWVILKSRKIRTRGTHGKVSANWSFQFPSALEGVVQTFTALHDEWQAFFNAHCDCQFPKWTGYRDTDPASTDRHKMKLSKVGCIFSSIVSEELLNWFCLIPKTAPTTIEISTVFWRRPFNLLMK
jgi:hypothetical protein